ncbi:MAG TPA: hypothetical protein VLG50_07450 [Candidatus Saccharimonadales bacterium]|nr:hypothetical protein [Candidatus Saccharimonadales bacterium]
MDLIYEIVLKFDSIHELKSLYLIDKQWMRVLNSQQVIQHYSKMYDIDIQFATFKQLVDYIDGLFLPDNSQFINRNGTYQTHDNRYRPYQVHVQYPEVEIDKNHPSIISYVCDLFYIINHTNYNYKPLLSFKSDKIWVGAGLSDYDKSITLGVSLLCHLIDNQYMYIGDIVYQWSSLYPIVYFVSIVGHNDVIYDYAIDNYGNIYTLSYGHMYIIYNTPKSYQVLKHYQYPYNFIYDKNNINMEFVQSFAPDNIYGEQNRV